MSFAVAPVATPQRARAFTAVVIAAAVAAAAAGTVALAHGAARDQTTTLAAVTLLAALSFVGSGLVAWRRRPQVWTGALMVAAGFCLFAGSLANFDSAVPFTIGLVVSPVAAAVIAHLVLSFPEGRLHSTLERLVVAGAYVVTIPLQVVMLMFMGFEHVTGCPCPSNLLFVRDDMALHSAIMTTQRLLGIALAVAAAGIVVRRWQHASAPLRRALGADPVDRGRDDPSPAGDVAGGAGVDARVGDRVGRRARGDGLGAVGVPTGAVPRTARPGRGERPDHGARPDARARSVARRARPSAARSVARACLLGSRIGGVCRHRWWARRAGRGRRVERSRCSSATASGSRRWCTTPRSPRIRRC